MLRNIKKEAAGCVSCSGDSGYLMNQAADSLYVTNLSIYSAMVTSHADPSALKYTEKVL
jgi:hypothetical protein